MKTATHFQQDLLSSTHVQQVLNCSSTPVCSMSLKRLWYQVNSNWSHRGYWLYRIRFLVATTKLKLNYKTVELGIKRLNDRIGYEWLKDFQRNSDDFPNGNDAKISKINIWKRKHIVCKCATKFQNTESTVTHKNEQFSVHEFPAGEL